jgi:hypothetical protein
MTPDDFTATLTERLRRRGVHALPEDVRAFTVDIGQRMTNAPDMDQWADLFIHTRQPSIQAAPRPRGRAGRGAVIGLLCSPLVMLAAGAVWGIMVRPAPCYGGGDPSMMEGAACGVLVSPILFGKPAAVASAAAGAIVGSCVKGHCPDSPS